MNSDPEDVTYDFTEEEMEQLLEEVEKASFYTGEEAIAIFEEKHKKLCAMRVKMTKKPKIILGGKPKDAYDEFLQEKEAVQSEYANEWVLN